MKKILLLLPFLITLNACADKPQTQHPAQKQQAHPSEYDKSRQQHQKSTQSYEYQGKVISVHDGDTLHIRDNHGAKHKIRMAYIDAPEAEQAHGKTSRDALRQLVLDKNVKVKVYERDQYGREVATIFLNNTDINQNQIEQGNAWHYVSIAKHQQDKSRFVEYRQAEQQAKQQRVGLWSGRNPQAPWAWRKQYRAN